jgi:Tfp pilus assembly protein PilN
MSSQLERVLFEEQAQRNKYLEKELAELKANYEELSKSLSKRKICSIM